MTNTQFEDRNGNVVIGRPVSTDSLKILFNARRCRLIIEAGVILENCTIHFDGDDGEVFIGRNSEYRGSMRLGIAGRISIGHTLYVTGNCFISALEAQAVTIGNDCLFGSSVDIRTDDAHPIFDRSSGERINKSSSVEIGNHVWLAAHVAVGRGAVVGEGSVIGYRSYVRAAIPAHCIAVGSPAKVTREDIVWDRAHLSMHIKTIVDHLDELDHPVWTPTPF